MEQFITPFIEIGMIIFALGVVYLPGKIDKVLERRRWLRKQRECMRKLSDGRTFSGYKAIPSIDHCALEKQLAKVNTQLAKLDEDDLDVGVWGGSDQGGA